MTCHVINNAIDINWHKPTKLFRGLIIFICSLLFSVQAGAVSHYDFNDHAKGVYYDILNLQLNRTQSDLPGDGAADPENGIYFLLDNYFDIIQILVLDEADLYKRSRSSMNQRIRKLRKGPDTSPWHRYCQAELMLQWSILDYKYGHWWRAYLNVRDAHALLLENKEIFPEFMPTYRSLGVIRAFMGTLPISGSLKWLIRQISGMSGTISEGMADVRSVLEFANDNDYVFSDETRAIYAYMLVHLENKPEAAWNVIQGMKGPVFRGALGAFSRANLALRTGRIAQCLSILDEPAAANPDLPISFNWFLRGKAYLYLEDEQTESAFSTFLHLHQGDTYRYSAYQKLAWYQLMQGNLEEYKTVLGHCSARMDFLVGEDREAWIEATSNRIPDPVLLKARIFFDSRQYSKGLELLEEHEETYTISTEQVEYYYRLGRLKQGAGQIQEATDELMTAYEIGHSSSSYMICNAALQLGLIYESVDKPELAREWLNKALAHKPDSYKNSLHYKAKAALKRLE